MRVAVVGATGNVGTAVLAALQQRPEVTSVLGIARRLPDQDLAPYSFADWASIDIAAAVDPDQAVSELTGAFRGADAVIHLAWLIQPNTRRELLRRVNVDGTENVARAAAEAGVPRLVVASSVGAYSPSPGNEVREETWGTEGIRSSHYSVDKAAQERVLDEFEHAHPEIAVSRLRPALIFQSDAASQIQRYFLGTWMPIQALRAGRPPVLPLPAGMRIQAVHAADVAAAYAAAAVTGARGAFNICADDLLGMQELADIVDHGRFLQVPHSVVRAAFTAGHRARLLAADEGWFDMGMNVPVMSNERAKAELGWAPHHTAAEAVEELLEGMIAGHGAGSVPMRPRDVRRAQLPVDQVPAVAGAGARADGPSGRVGETAPGGATRHLPVEPRPQISEKVTQDLLNLYLSDHLTGASAGVERIERMAAAFVDTPVFAPLSSVGQEIRAERQFLEELIHDLGFRQLPHRQAVAWLGERAGRLKNNGRLATRSPMTMVLETELMRSAVIGKRGGWQTLQDNAELLGLDPEVFARLAENALRQAEILDQVHAYARRRAFRRDLETHTPQETDTPQD
ncbi:NAD-dependent epimerase/dehydratase family protein [Brachybacterium sp. GCM10030267]|uniref:NAD-dependent epimerase/dehydratase family protein n=1 Tax=Brachybacterium sp. GCM10030267 TaxID=3273381 RepID=UPI003607BF8A